jgi:hypothetical protein
MGDPSVVPNTLMNDMQDFSSVERVTRLAVPHSLTVETERGRTDAEFALRFLPRSLWRRPGRCLKRSLSRPIEAVVDLALADGSRPPT